MADAIGATTDVIKGIIPKTQVFGTGFVNMLAWFIVLVVVLIGFGIAIFFLIRAKKFNRRIIIFEEINGHFEQTGRDRAAEIKFSTAGDTIFYTLRTRKYLPVPSLQSGRRVYWYFIRSDGEWINFALDNLNQLSKKAGARFLDKEVRFARTQIQKGLKDRYDKPTFWNQYGVMIMNIAWVAMIGVMTWLLFDKWLDLAGATNAGVETAGIVMEQVSNVLAKMDNVCAGSGIR